MNEIFLRIKNELYLILNAAILNLQLMKVMSFARELYTKLSQQNPSIFALVVTIFEI